MIIHADCIVAMREMPTGSIDAIVTDPPYGLSFMGKGWDHGVPGVEFWTEALRVAKPGAHLLAFGGTRTYHRLACAIEDAGWEIRDCVMWVYGSGFPKSLDVSKAIDKAAGAEREVLGIDPVRFARLKNQVAGSVSTGEQWEHGRRDVSITAHATEAARQWQGWGTALKPAWEPIIVARKPLVGTVAENVLAHGTGALNIDGCRIETSDRWHRENGCNAGLGGDFLRHKKEMPRSGNDAGRWPANLIHDGSEEVLAGFPETASGGDGNGAQKGEFLRGVGDTGSPRIYDKNKGSAARFFYSAKASKADRGEGNHHPTVKPTALMRYLCRLVTPPGGVVLDPFMGSGSTGKAAVLEGFRFIGIEREAEYVEIARARVAHALTTKEMELPL